SPRCFGPRRVHPAPRAWACRRPRPAAGGERVSRRWRHSVGFLVVAAGVLLRGWGVYAGIQGRRGADAALSRVTKEAATPTVSVVYPSTSAATDELVLPGTARAFTDAPIYARASGYLKKWHVDIGSPRDTGRAPPARGTPH